MRRTTAAFLEFEVRSTELVVRCADGSWRIPGSEVSRRNELVRKFLNLEVTHGRDFFSMEASSRRVRERWTEIARWDYDKVLHPLLVEGEPPDAILYDVSGPLLEFSARRALWQGLLDELVPPAIFASLTTFPVWGGLGLERLAHALIRGSVPLVRLETLDVVIGHIPSALEDDLLMGLARAEEDGDPRPIAIVAQEVLDDLSELVLEDVRTHAILRELREISHRVGFKLETQCDRATFLKFLEQGPLDRTLVVVAHQDHQGIHFSDGALGLETLRSVLSDLRGQLPWSSVLSMVCGSSQPMNLAHCMQAAGVPVVLTHGARTFRGVSLGAVLVMVRNLLELGPTTLGRLVDRGVEGWRA